MKIISKQALFLLEKMLLNPEKQEISELINNEWITKSISYTGPIKNIIELGILQNQILLSRLQTAIKNFAKPLTIEDCENMGKIKQLFDFFDADSDGEISGLDLLEGYKKIYEGNCSRAKKEYKQMEKFVKISANNNIDYYGIFIIFLNLQRIFECKYGKTKSLK